MAPVNPSKGAVENTDDVDELRNIELQAAFLFDEFLRIYHPADTFDDERSDSPVPMPAPQSYKAKGLDQEYLKLSNFDDSDLECDCSPLGAPKIAQEESGVKNGHQTSPIPLPATQSERNESDFVAQGPVQETAAASLDADQVKNLKEVAVQLRGAGDQFAKQFGPQMGEIQNTLVTFVRQQGTQLTYDALANMIQHEVERGTDINLSTFIMTLLLSKTVCSKAGSVCAYLPSYFRQYVTQRYPDKMQQSGGVESFVMSSRRVMPQ